MKNLIYMFYFFSLTISAQVVQNPLTPLEAFQNTTWEWSDSQIKLEISFKNLALEMGKPENGNVFYFAYKIIGLNDNSILYETAETIGIFDKDFGGALGSHIDNQPYLRGLIIDKSDTNYAYGIEGMLKLTYIPCEGVLCSPQLQWELKKPKELLYFQGAPDDYNLPTDIILTKVD